ncbi:MAG TPA: GGDEF domain-containing protein, partial [Mycobacteriales bacterium]|nr:GGDEF domain-containing protein [Mycobacteriales bacterium]
MRLRSDVVGGVRRGLTQRSAAAIGAVLVAVLAVAGIGLLGLHRMKADTDSLIDHTVADLVATAGLVSAVSGARDTALQQVAVSDPAVADRLGRQLDLSAIPRLRESVRTLRLLTADDPESGIDLDQIQADVDRYQRLRGTVDRRATDGSALTRAERAALATQINDVFDGMVASSESIRGREAAEAQDAGESAQSTYASTRTGLLAGSALSVLAGLIALLVLGRRRQAADRSAADQADFTDTLQVTGSEEEAHELVRRHLDRALPHAHTLVLARNNSENRLEAATALPPDSPVAGRLLGAEPRSCLALRFGRTHREDPARSPLLSCALCSDEHNRSTCEPLLVGGRVIGSVLVTHPRLLTRPQDAVVRSSVAQAAPVLANLRNLALAEFRANNDSLTGLPNKRATDDTLKRMVAQANRTGSPLAAAMLDLDHFKQVNDRFGHGKGDEVLAAVGAAIRSCLRASDFAGRFGGEELLVLLPDTAAGAAVVLAERIREAVAAIAVPGVDRQITVSIGVADLLQPNGDGAGLLRQADRALYAAKAAGRNRTLVAPSGERSPGDATPPAATPPLDSAPARPADPGRAGTADAA